MIPPTPWPATIPWPCKYRNQEPIGTIWRPAESDGVSPFDTEQRVCAGCWETRNPSGTASVATASVGAASVAAEAERSDLEMHLRDRRVALRVYFEHEGHRWPSLVETVTFMGLHIRCLREAHELNKDDDMMVPAAAKEAFYATQLRRSATGEVVSPGGGRAFLDVVGAPVLQGETFVLEDREPRARRQHQPQGEEAASAAGAEAASEAAAKATSYSGAEQPEEPEEAIRKIRKTR